MKNKPLTYVLLIAVGFIWFKVFVRIKSNLTQDELAGAAGDRIEVLQLPTSRDTFELAANYRDPFLTNTIKAKSKGNTENKQPIAPIRKPAYQWPSIKYFGLVKKTKSSKPLAIVKFDQVQLMVRENDQVWSDIQIRKIYRDSILISHGKDKKVVYRN